MSVAEGARVDQWVAMHTSNALLFGSFQGGSSREPGSGCAVEHAILEALLLYLPAMCLLLLHK